MASIGVGVVLVAVTASSGLRGASHTLDAIGRQAAPSIVAAQAIRFAVADIDANLTNVLLVGDRSDLGITRAEALKIIANDRAVAATALVEAAKNITFGRPSRIRSPRSSTS